MGGGERNDPTGGGAAAIPVEDAFSWMFRPPVTQEQTDAWFQPPPAQPSELPTPPEPQETYQSSPVRYLLNDVRQGILPDEALAEIQRDPTSLRSMMAYGEGALGVGTLLAGGEGVKLPMGEVPLPKMDLPMPSKLPAGEGFVWGAKPLEDIQGLPKSGVMPESRFAKAGSEAGQFSGDELALMKRVVPEAFTETGVNVPKLHEGLAQSGPVVEVKKLGESQRVPTENMNRLTEITHQLDTQFPDWIQQRDMIDAPQELRNLVQERDNRANRVIAEGQTTEGMGRYAFVGPKPEAQMPGYVEGLVRLPLTELQQKYSGSSHASYDTPFSREVYQGPHFGAEDRNVLSSYRGYEEALPNGEKAFHVIEVQSDWGQAHRDEPLPAGISGATPGHPLLPHYETLGLKAAIQHAKEIGATKVILPDAETAMMTEGHDNPANIQHKPVAGAQPTKVTGPYEFNWRTPLPAGWTGKGEIGGGTRIAADPNGKLFQLHAVDARAPASDITAENIGRKTPGSGLWQAEVWALPVEPKISQEGGMRLHYDQTLPSAMRKLTGDKGTPVDLGTHKSGQFERAGGMTSNSQELLRTPNEAEARQLARSQQGEVARIGDQYVVYKNPPAGSPVFKDAAGKPKTNITGKIYDISKTPDQFKLMKAGDKFSAAKYLAA